MPPKNPPGVSPDTTLNGGDVPVGAVEDVSKRTRNAKQYDNGDGTFTAVIGHDIHYPGPSGWEDVDLNYRTSGTEFVVDKHYLKTRLYRRSTSSRLVITEKESNKGIEFTLPGAPVPTGRRIRFDRDGLSWEYATRKSGLKLAATVSARQGAKTYSFGYALQGGAAALSVDADGNILSDAFMMPRAYAIGADYRVYPCGAWRVSAGTVSFDWDDSQLPASAFPYELDPTTTFAISASGNDSSAENNATVYPPNTTPALTPTQTFLVLGRTFGTDSRYYTGVGLMRFDTASIPDTSTVDAATLRGFVEIRESVNSLSVVMGYFAWNGTTSDWTNTAPADAHAGTPIANIVAAADRDFALQNLTNINKQGNTSIRAAVTQLAKDAAPTGGNYAIISSWDHTTNAEPRLIVTFSDTTPPAVPTSLTALPGNNRAYLDWADNTETDFSHYNVYRGTAAGGPYTKVNTANITASAFTDTGVTNGTKYFYVVRSVDTTGNESGNSAEVNVTPVATPPATPTGLTSTTKSTTRIDVAWSANTETDLAGYNLYRSLNADGSTPTKVNGPLLTTTSHSDTGLTINTDYYYYLTAVDTEGAESARSSIVHDKTFNIVRLRPDSIVTQNNLTGALANIQDDPDAPDALWWAATAPSGSVGLQGASAHAASSGIANQLTNPANALGTDEATQATVVAGTVNADYSNFFSFGSIFGGIPDNAIITGVTVQTREWASSANRSSSFARLESANGTAISAELGGTVTTTIPAAGQPKNTYTAWDVLPTVAQLKAAGFGVRVRFVRTATQAIDYSLDWIKVSVTWQLPAADNNTLSRTGMENPSNLPVIGAGMQEIRARLRKAGNGANPTARVEVREAGGGVALATPIADTAIGADGVLAGTWDIAALADRYGMSVELVVVGTGTQGAAVEVGAIEWNATVSKDPSIHVLSPPPANNGEEFNTPRQQTRVNAPPSDFSFTPEVPSLRISAYVQALLSAEDVPPPEIIQLGGVFAPPINSAEAFGTPKLHLTLYSGSVGTGEAFGNPTIVQIVSAGTTPSEEAHETHASTVIVLPPSMASEESSPTPSSLLVLHPAETPASEDIPPPTLRLTFYSGSVVSEETVLIPTIIDKGIASPKGRLVAVKVVRELAPYIAGYQVPYDISTQFYVSNIRGDEIAPLPGVRSASVDMSNARDETWKLSLSMQANKDINILRDWVKVVVVVKLADGKVRRFPYGVYKFFRPSGEKSIHGVVWNLEGFSAESLFTEDTVRGVYVVPKGTMALGRIRELLLERGVPPERIKLPLQRDVPTRADMVFDPFADESRGKRIRIMNELANTSGFHAVYADRAGNFTTRQYRDVRSQDVAITYGPNWPDEEPILTGKVSDNWEDDRFANAVVVTEEEADNPNPLFAVAENNDINSLGSYRNLGYWKTKIIKYKTLASQEVANNIAQGQLQAASGFYRKAGWTTPPDPERQEKEYAQLNVVDDVHDIVGRFKIDNLGFDAYPNPKEFTYAGSKLEEI